MVSAIYAGDKPNGMSLKISEESPGLKTYPALAYPLGYRTFTAMAAGKEL